MAEGGGVSVFRVYFKNGCVSRATSTKCLCHCVTNERTLNLVTCNYTVSRVIFH